MKHCLIMPREFILLLFLLTIHQFHSGKSNNVPRVKISLGPIVGTSRVTETGKKIGSFEGIPYIKPPVGDLRFKAPQPVEPWSTELHATNSSTQCIKTLGGKILGTEDCVVLNVHTPWDSSNGFPDQPLPVMMYIHGGGFTHGSGRSEFVGLPDYLLEHDVVLVTINYRLGVLGYLSTEDHEAPGNYGLLDQVEALKWIRNNIAAFGGNPNQVTIFGNSAGSASVHFLMLSPLSKGLFHRGIGQSGVGICPWATTQRSKEPAQKLAKEVGCAQSPSSEMLDCLRTKDAETLVTTYVIEENKRHGHLPYVWSPRVDAESSAPFLPKHPVDLMTSGDYSRVPVLFGHTILEAGSYLSYPRQFPGPTVSEMDDRWDNSCKVFMGFREFFVPEHKGSKWCSDVKKHYIDSKKSFKESILDYATILGDAWFLSPIYKATKLMSKHGDVYSYVFGYDEGRVSFLDLRKGLGKKIKGNVGHCDELIYLFKFPQTGWTQESPEIKIVDIMTKIWTDFAKTGVPSVPYRSESWPKASWPDHQYVLIGTNLSIEENYHRQDMEFLENIYNNALFKVSSKSKDEL